MFAFGNEQIGYARHEREYTDRKGLHVHGAGPTGPVDEVCAAYEAM